MITTGPYSLSAGTPLTVYDPAKYIAASASVQAQNDSGLSLILSVGGLSLPVPPRTIVTVPTGTAPQLIITPSAVSGSSTGGSLTLVWLLPGETSPVADGPITISTTISSTVAVSSQTLANTVNSALQLTLATLTPPSQQVSTAITTGSAGATFTIIGNLSSHVYYSGSLGASVTETVSFPFTPSYGDTSLELSVSAGIASFSSSSSAYVETSQLTPTASSLTIIYQILTSQAGFSGAVIDQLGAIVTGSTFDLGQAPGAYSLVLSITSITDQLPLQIWGAGLGTDWKVLAASSVG